MPPKSYIASYAAISASTCPNESGKPDDVGIAPGNLDDTPTFWLIRWWNSFGNSFVGGKPRLPGALFNVGVEFEPYNGCGGAT